MKNKQLFNKIKSKCPLIVILGPTASGKSAVSIELSKLLDIEIISADSRQIYRYLNIGTAKPSDDELRTVPHHFIDIVNPDQYYSAGKFGTEAEKSALTIISKGKIPVVAGGSGLYIQALCEGLFDGELNDYNSETRQILQKRIEDEGKKKLYSELKAIDPDLANKYSDLNPRRIIRALEYFYNTGNQLSKAQNIKIEKPFKVFYFGIYHDRNLLYQRINDRTMKMWEQGLADETRSILRLGYSPELNSLNTVGYKETLKYLNGKFSEEETIEEIKKNTRRYAKRQMTWFRKNSEIDWLAGNDNPKLTTENILEKLSVSA